MVVVGVLTTLSSYIVAAAWSHCKSLIRPSFEDEMSRTVTVSLQDGRHFVLARHRLGGRWFVGWGLTSLTSPTSSCRSCLRRVSVLGPGLRVVSIGSTIGMKWDRERPAQQVRVFLRDLLVSSKDSGGLHEIMQSPEFTRLDMLLQAEIQGFSGNAPCGDSGSEVYCTDVGFVLLLILVCSRVV